jgi:RimJ/RimL family protein N-acetyltransferase
LSSPPELPLGSQVAAADPAPPPRRVPLEGRFVRLRPPEPDGDVDALYAGSHGPLDREALWTYMGYGPFAGREAMLAWLRALVDSDDPLFYSVCDASSGRPVGMASFLAVRPAMRVIEVGHIWYVPEAQRTRANTEAAYLLLREAIDRLGYRRVEWKCDALNERSRRAAVRLGFSYEGLFRQHMLVKGRNRDTAWYALLDRDWPRVRANMERYLAAPAGTVSLARLNAGASPPAGDAPPP